MLLREEVVAMYTLYLDTHGTNIIIVLFKDRKVFRKSEVETHQNHSMTIMPILLDILTSAGIEVQNIKEILVTNGPGSFTGVRLGVTIAKTLSFTLKIPIKTISSLEIKAVSFSHEKVRIVEREKNGVFLGTFTKENQLIGDYQYVLNKEFVASDDDVENVEIDYEKIVNFSTNLPSVVSHAVNPLYVKQIEVQK